MGCPLKSKMDTSTGIARNRSTFLCLLPLLSLLAFSCASKIKHYAQLNQYLVNRDYDSAMRVVKKNKKAYGKRSLALYYLEEGIIAHYASDHEESNEYLSQAESVMEALYTKSLSKGAASFLINDNTIPYRGEDFENALVNLFMALNYAGLGRWEDALVEARKVDMKLSVINSRYEEDKKNVYREDAFIRFLMGVLYEAEGEDNDAFISYRKAEEIYETDYLQNYGISSPSCLIENLIVSAQAMEFFEEAEEIQNEYPDVACVSPAQKESMAEILFVHYNGVGPEKVEKQWLIPMPDGYVAKAAYPSFERRDYRISHGVITLKSLTSDHSYRFPTVLMEDIGSIAARNLENRLDRIKAKAIARATVKYLAVKAASEVAEEEGGAMVGFLVQVAGNLAALVTENADVRHWRLLPAEIRGGRVLVPPGEYEGEIEFVDASGGVVLSTSIDPFTVEAGEKRFFTHRTLR